jgi:hypothetical protein
MKRLSGRAVGAIVVLAVAGSLAGATDARAANYGNGRGFASGPSAFLAVDGTGDVFAAGTSGGQVVETSPDGQTQSVLAPVFDTISGLAADSSGDVFVSESSDNVVVEIQPDGTQLNIGSDLAGPAGLAVDAAGDVFIAETGSDRIVKVAPDGTQTTVASGVLASSGDNQIAANAAGDVFLPDNGVGSVEEISPNGATSFIANDLGGMRSVAVDVFGDVIVNTTDKDDADNLPESNTIIVAPDGTETDYFHMYYQDGDSAPPLGVAVDSRGDIFDGYRYGIDEIPVVSDSTSTDLQCDAPAPAGTARSCTVAVADTQNASHIPTGTVDLTASGQGAFSASSCILSNGACAIGYTPTVAGNGSQILTASYGGDTDDESSSGSTTLDITGATSATSESCTKPTAKQLTKVKNGKAITLTCTATTKGPKSTSRIPTGTESFSASPSTDNAEGFPTGSSCTLKKLSGGKASCSVQFETAAPDTYTVTANYGSDPYYFVSSGQATLSTE